MESANHDVITVITKICIIYWPGMNLNLQKLRGIVSDSIGAKPRSSNRWVASHQCKISD